MPRYDDDDRPRRSGRKKSRRKKANTTPLLAAGGVGLVVLVVGLFFAFRWAITDRPTKTAGPVANANAGGGAVTGAENANAGGAVVPAKGGENAAATAPAPPKAGGVKYVPRESEKRFEEYRKANPDKQLTDKEVFAIMGEPTRIDPPITVQRNGMTITVYEVYWEVPGSGISSQMGFANGLEAGGVIGLEVTPRK